ncbi:MAG: protein kinase [Chloroflexi bacterium]|nr:protein kinase [Chloroflexota bacterium]
MESNPLDTPGPGMVLGHFVIDEALGAGAMGTVYLGHDRRDTSKVAIKLLNAELSADSSFRQRFEREAHLATLLKSPYTVRVLDFGRAGAYFYFVMEFVEGDSVAQILQRGPMPLEDSLEIAADAARALEALSTQNIVHRDMKPSNIIVSPDGAAKLVDFGISQQAHSRDANVSFVGTAQYAAPEQQTGRTDARSDIYALGATLFHMLAGRPPYTGRSDEEVLRQHLHAPFPAQLLSWHPEPVVDVVRRCMQKEPEDRYQTASELAGAIDRLQARLAAFPPPPAKLGTPSSPNLIPEPEQHDPASGGTLVLAPRGAQPIGVPVRRPNEPEPDDDHAGGSTVVFAAPGTLAPPAAPSLPPAAATAAPYPIPVAPRDVPGPAPAPAPAAAGGGRKGLFIVMAAVVVALIGAGGAFALLAGGGGDSKANTPSTPTTQASATAGTGASPAASSSASPSATAEPSATTAATAAPTDTATAAPTTPPTTAPAPTSAPAATPTAPPAATTPPQPPPPTNTPVPAGASYTILGFSTSGFQGGSIPPLSSSLSGPCNGDVNVHVFISHSNAPSGTSLNVTFSPATGVGNSPATVSGSGTAQFPNAISSSGSYSVGVTANGGNVGGGGFSFTCQ